MVIVLAVVVAALVTGLLTRRVLAARHQVRVLDCPVVGAVAHHHDDSCFDEEGNLVCSLPERELHTHDESCYERQLVCGKDEGDGAHYHDDGCYDDEGNLVCGQEESDGHQHDDSCYADVLVCGLEECTREHAHGDGCWQLVAANEDAVEATHPEQTFRHDVRDKDRQLQLRIDADAPLGALPAGSTMDVKLLDADKVDVPLVQKALDKAAEQRAAKKSDDAAPEAGMILKWQAVDVTFRDAEGNEVQPEKDVTVTLTSKLAKTADARSVVRVEDEAEAERRAAEQAHAAGETQAADDTAQQLVVKGDQDDQGKPEIEAQAVEQLSEQQLKERKLELRSGQVAFDADRSTTYVLATTSLSHEMTATDGSTVSISVDATPEAAIPQDATLDVTRVNPEDDGYGDYVDRTVESMGASRTDVALASFFDIKIRDAEGNEIHPQAPVDVKIELTDIPDAPSGFAAVHFREAGEGDEATTELERLQCGGENGTVTFAADSFSVYGIVYTVDFGYEVDGQLYQWTLPGGGSMGLRALVDALRIHEGEPRAYDDAASFMADVQNVTFSDPSLVWVEPVPAGQARTLGDILETNGLEPEYAAGTSEEQKSEWLGDTYEDDWALISLRPFATTEMLTITMADGSQRLVVVTDAQDGQLSAGGPLGASDGVPDPIPNPAGTTIDLFDYWIDDGLKDRTAREAWPDFPGDWSRNCNIDGQNLRGSGANKGINYDHAFKFNPAAEWAVFDGPWDPGQQKLTGNNDNNNQTMNAYTGSADPRAGLVKKNLDDNGYPVLAGDPSQYSQVGTNGESLAYLFDESDYQGGADGQHTQGGKERFEGADQLLYVDDQGYYTFDSYKYYASFDKDSRTFSLEDQNGRTGDSRGFWPFGDQRYWSGLHMKTQFSMPEDGRVLGPNGLYNDMTFEFMGDDDTWLYIDGVLVGDGGGIHNRTDISINYATGEVTVSGKNDDNHAGGYEQPTTLRQLFADALAEQGKSQQEIDEYLAANFDGDTFKDNTYHTFDMFYLERGGGESNLYIRYNLVSTADFTGHKDYQGSNSDDILERDDFQFELIGLDGEYEYNEVRDGDGNITSFTLVPGDQPGDETRDAIMPKHDRADGDWPGSVMHPYYEQDATAELIDGTQVPAQVYATGVTEDGNINFGMADITYDMREAYGLGRRPAYKYMIREVIPPDAVNKYGKRYEDCSEQERIESSWFTKDDVMYDADVHFMLAAITSWEVDGVTHYGLTKRYFTDDSFSEMRSQVFVSFDNRYVDPLKINLVKKDTSDTPLPNAEFSLVHAAPNETMSAWVPADGDAARTVTTGAGGLAEIDGISAGTYILQETKPPAGYRRPQKKWLVETYRKDMVDVDAGGGNVTAKPASELQDGETVVRKYTVLGAELTELNAAGEPMGQPVEQTVTNGAFTLEDEIVNEPAPPFELTVEKHWGGIDLTDPDDAAAVANSQVVVTLGRYKLADMAGTLDIVKKGVPAGAHVTATYVVRDEGGAEVARLSNGTWDGQDVTVGSLSLAPGTYTVEETIDSDDGRYTATHNDGADNPQQKQIVDEGSETATFTSTYTPKTGSLAITSTLDNQTNPAETIDTSGVKYQLYDADNNLVGTYHLDSDFTRTGDTWTMTVPDLLIGDYRVVESGWPEPGGNIRCTHTNGTELSGTVTEADTPSLGFTTIYNTGYPVKVIVYRVQQQDGSMTDNDGKKIYEGVVTTTDIQLHFSAKSGSGIKVGTSIGSDDLAPGGSQIQWESGDQNNLRNATLDVTIPAGHDDDQNPFVIVISTGWGWSDAIGSTATVDELVPTFGALNVTAQLTDSRTDQTSPVDTSSVVYNVKDGGGNTVASCTYAQATAAGGHTFNNLPTGSYTVETDGWPTDGSASYSHAYSPAGGAVSVTDGGTASCAVATTAADPASSVTVRLYFRQGDYASYSLVTEESIAANQVALLIEAGGVYDAPLVFKDADDAELSPTKSGGGGSVQYVFDLPSGASEYDIYASCSWWGSMPGNTSLSEYPASGTNSAQSPNRLFAAPRLSRGALAAPARRGSVSPGSETASSSDSGDKPTPAETNKKYVVDGSFTTDNTVTLTAADLDGGVWRERVSTLPADDGNGNKYYYFIESVSETGLPVGTELTIVKDGSDKMLAFERDDYAEPNHLVARNVVGTTADVSLLKVDADDSSPIGGATFHLAKVEGQAEAVVTSPTVSPMSSGQTVTVGADGSFNVPEGGVLIESLQPGTYKVVEDTPPNGYVMTDTVEVEFTVASDGTVSETSGGAPVASPQHLSNNTITVPNVAGSALPHSGGVGTLVSTVAGVGLVAAGILVVLSKRRRSTVSN